MDNDYVPSGEILEKYANVMVNFALGNGKGIKKGDVVYLQIPEIAKPFLKPLYRAILKAGGNPIVNFLPDDMKTEIFEHGSDEQISYFPSKAMKGRVDEVDHMLFIIAEKDPKELKDVDAKKIMMFQKPMKQYMEWRNEKENKGKLSWSLCLFATPAVAKEAGMSLKEYWDEIIKACYLNEEDPVTKWREIQEEMHRIIDELAKLDIEKVHVVAENTDLWLRIGDGRKWLGGTGCNIPSFEIFTSPDWRGTNGFIEFSEPLYRYGNLIKGIRLEFEDGIVTKFSATENEDLLKEMLEVENADKIGEFSLTDGRMSRITKFMAETLFDENTGGEFGNTHLAIGTCFDMVYPGDMSEMNDEIRERMGLNKSAIHSDIVSTTNRVVTAVLSNGSEKVIYRDGKFTL